MGTPDTGTDFVLSAEADELTKERNRCKGALDQAQAALNQRLLADSPVKRGDIVDDEGTIFRILSVSVKTFYDDGHLHDRLRIEFQKQQTVGTQSSWLKVNSNTADLASRVLSGKAKIVRHARV